MMILISESVSSYMYCTYIIILIYKVVSESVNKTKSQICFRKPSISFCGLFVVNYKICFTTLSLISTHASVTIIFRVKTQKN